MIRKNGVYDPSHVQAFLFLSGIPDLPALEGGKNPLEQILENIRFRESKDLFFIDAESCLRSPTMLK